MTKKKDDKGVERIGSTSATKGVKGTSAVDAVDKVKAASGVQRVSGVKGIKAASGVSGISFEQRERLLSMVSEEAEKLAAQGFIPKNQREVVEQAVKMIIDSTLLEPSADKDGKK
jgi:hypothetical protein